MLGVAAGCWSIAAVSVAIPSIAGTLAPLAGLLAGAIVIALTRQPAARGRQLQRVLALTAVTLALGSAISGNVATLRAQQEGTAAVLREAGGATSAEVIVTGKLERFGQKWRFDAVTKAIAGAPGTRGGDIIATRIPVMVMVDEPGLIENLDVGSRVVVTGRFADAPVEDRARWWIAARALDIREPPSGVLAVTGGMRAHLLASAATLGGHAGELVPGLAVGDTRAVSRDLDADMKASSLSHLTAVSGANCALVVALSWGVVALLRGGRMLRIVVSLGALISFVALVTPEPSVVRAATMAGVAMLAVLLGRPGAGVSVCALSVSLILLLDPWLALSLGFALSTAATLALILLAGPLADSLARWMPHPLALALAVPVAAQLACAPLLALITPTVSLTGVLANMLAGPAAPLATMLGLMACVSAPIPAISIALVHAAGIPAAWIAAVARSQAESNVLFVAGPLGFVALGLFGLCIGWLFLGRAGGWGRRMAAVILASVAIVAAGVGPGREVFTRAGVPDQWRMLACEVGQGDAILVRSATRVALIDTGPDPAPLRRCLERYGVGHIDLLVLTHFDADHRGGVDAVIGKVDTVIHGPPADGGDEGLLAVLRSHGASTQEGYGGQGGTLGELSWQLLWPSPVSMPGNDASLVAHFAGPGLDCALFLGDLSADAQESLLPRVTACAIVKVAHHGSADQSAALYARAAPAVAVVTVGENDYGHPRIEIMTTLAQIGASVFRTDEQGDIALWSGPDGVHVWRAR